MLNVLKPDTARGVGVIFEQPADPLDVLLDRRSHRLQRRLLCCGKFLENPSVTEINEDSLLVESFRRPFWLREIA